MNKPYKGYSYFSDVELEDDNIKLWHVIVNPLGQRLSLDETPEIFRRIGPYEYPTQVQFELAIDELTENE